MKYFLLTLFFHTAAGSWNHNTDIQRVYNYPAVELMQVRLAPWPINIQRFIYYTDTCYAVQFRDQSAANAVIYKSLDLETITQLKYFRDALIVLKKGSSGDIAEFSNYSIKKVGKRKEDSWYILSFGGAVTNFQEAQTNRMIFIINDLIASQH